MADDFSDETMADGYRRQAEALEPANSDDDTAAFEAWLEGRIEAGDGVLMFPELRNLLEEAFAAGVEYARDLRHVREDGMIDTHIHRWVVEEAGTATLYRAHCVCGMRTHPSLRRAAYPLDTSACWNGIHFLKGNDAEACLCGFIRVYKFTSDEPPETVRCLCPDPPDVDPACPVDHGQIRHERQPHE